MHIIRTSDRRAFKKCRRAWDFGSKIRQNYEPLVTARPLEFGIAVHSALQVYYEPKTWKWDRQVIEGLALTSYVQSMKESRAEAIRKLTTRNMSLPEEDDAQWQEGYELGIKILNNYFRWAPAHDKFTPVHVELELSVPIWVGNEPLRCDCCDELILHQGRIDLIVLDEYGEYWIFDHKTVKQMSDQMEHLLRDEQCGAYCVMAQRMLDIPIAGVIYSELRKDAPHAPKELVNGGLSKNKQQNTTYDLYMAEIMMKGLNPADYSDMLDYLQHQGNKFFNRTTVHRSQTELRNLELQIGDEALDMINNPRIYPNPSKINCFNCAFSTPCLAANDGSDVQYILDSMYTKREEVKVG